MADRAESSVIEVRLMSSSAATVQGLADAIASLPDVAVLGRSVPRPGSRTSVERVCMTVLCGYPPVSKVHAWLAANGWEKGDESPVKALWHRAPHDCVAVPLDAAAVGWRRGALKEIAAAVGMSLGELVAAIHVQVTAPESPNQEGTEDG